MAMKIFAQRTVLLIALSLGVATSIGAQSTNAADVQYLLLLQKELQLTPEQLHQADSLFYQASYEISFIDKEIQSISRSNVAEEERTRNIRDLNARKKNIRDTRDLSVQLLLTDEQRVIYAEKIKPAKPAVIHMGMNHDRANCNVCIP